MFVHAVLVYIRADFVYLIEIEQKRICFKAVCKYKIVKVFPLATLNTFTVNIEGGGCLRTRMSVSTKRIMIICKNCGVENLDGTRFCQGCGRPLIPARHLFKNGNFKFLAGAGTKGSSIAPLVALSTERQAKELGGVLPRRKHMVKVVPLQNGSWYCPDCGQLNLPHALFCNSCGRDFI